MDEKKLYYFLGSETVIGDITLDKFGHPILLTDAEALNALEGHAQLCPAADFNFTEQEVSLYPTPLFREEANEAFKAKYKVALVAVQAHLAALKG